MRFFISLLCSMGIAGLLQGTAAVADETYSTSHGQTVAVLDIFQDCDVCPEMVVLPLGRFQFGSTLNEAIEARQRYFTNRGIDLSEFPADNNAFRNELPKHDVTIDLPIAMGRNEITREEWAACVDDGHCTDLFDERIHLRLPNGPYQDHPRSPITAITYQQIQDYIVWLNDKVGGDMYRLPTEAEWEYAARAGSTTPFSQGGTLTREQANFGVSWCELVDGKCEWHYDPSNERKPIAVDQLAAANAWGLRHMSGNIIEVTRSCWSERHLGFDSSSRYLAATVQPLGCKRVVKGGYYSGNIELARPARRHGTPEANWSPSRGFRVARDMPVIPAKDK